MADQDELVQVGSEIILEESVAQDNTCEGDLFLQPNPEVALGATVTMLGDPLHQIPPTENLKIPMGSTPDHTGSASSGQPTRQQFMELVEILTNFQNQQRSDMQNFRTEM